MTDSVDFDLHEELEALKSLDTYDISNETDFSSDDPESEIDKVVEAIASQSELVCHPEIFDLYRSLLKHADKITGPGMSKLLDSISSGFTTQIDQLKREAAEDMDSQAEHRKPIEIYAFLISWFIFAVEKCQSESTDGPGTPVPKARRGRGGKAGGTSRSAASKKKADASWTWISQIPATMTMLGKVLFNLRQLALRIWTTGTERDTFVTCLTKPIYHIMENETYMKSFEIQKTSLNVIALSVKHHGHHSGAQDHIEQFLQWHEHLAEPMAELLRGLSEEMDYPQLADSVLSAISEKHFTTTETKGPKTFSKFLIRLADLSPKSYMKQLSIILQQLDSESWQMRMGMVEVLGNLIKNLAASQSTGVDQEQTTKTVRGLYSLLLERTLDLSTFVRSKVFVVFAKLAHDVSDPYPKDRMRVAEKAMAALHDKVATVRKNALAVLIALMETHPYDTAEWKKQRLANVETGGLLGHEEWQKEYERVKGRLDEMQAGFGDAIQNDEDEDEDEEDSQRKDGEEMDVDGDDDGEATQKTDDDMPIDGATPSSSPSRKRPRLSKGRTSTANVEALNSEQRKMALLDPDLLTALRLYKKFLGAALQFIRILQGCTGAAVHLLGSTHKGEVLEAMEFFKYAKERELEGAEVGLKRMVHLIWTKDNNSSTSEDGKELKGIRSRLLEVYRSLYFVPVNGIAPKDQVSRIAKNMVERTYDATLAELTSLEEMIRIMMEDEQVHEDVIGKLWQIYTTDKALPKPQRRGAILILGMCALAKRSILTDRVDAMLRVGLGKFGKADLTLARYTCVALQRLNGSAKKVKGSLEDKTLRIEMDSPIFKKLQDILEMPCRSKEWFGLAEQAINTVYALGEKPDEFCNEFIKKLTVRAFTTETAAPAGQSQEEPAVERGSEDGDGGEDGMNVDGEGGSEGGSKDMGDPFKLSQLLFVVGHVAIKHIVYLEIVEREWKRQKDERQAAEKKAAQAQPKSRKDKEGEDLDQVVGNAEDEIGEHMHEVREKELLFGENSLLAVYGKMLVQIAGSPQIYKNKTLRAIATLSFSKFLCVSSAFCEEHHMLLFRILETSKDPNIRSNIVIALGDAAVSFSSVIDENSDLLYKGLSDSDLIVKKNTLMVLTHLILNGMIKVKGQLGEMAKCLEDEDTRISDLAKLFFTELATKDNAIYNNLPDVISHLSANTKHQVEEEAFQNIMRYIFQFVEKEKQCENMVEKLCQRFKLAEGPRQWRDLAFCMAQLQFRSERSVKKLIEGLPSYRDKLHDDGVFDRFQEILNKARQNKSPNKPDEELNEFEGILAGFRQDGEEAQALEKRVEKKKKKATKKAGRKKAAAPVEEDEEE